MHVYRMSDERWYTKIEAGAEGLVKAEWSPDGRHIVCFSEWAVSSLSFYYCLYFVAWNCRWANDEILHSKLRVTVWSLVSGAATYIQYPLHPDRGTESLVLIVDRSFLLLSAHSSRSHI